MEPEEGSERSEVAFSWDTLLDLAIDVGISHEEFWNMTLREFNRIVDVRMKQRKEREEAMWLRTAVQTTYFYNAMGQAWFKDFRAIKASDLFETWMGRKEPEDMEEKMRRFEQVEQELIKRDTWQ